MKGVDVAEILDPELEDQLRRDEAARLDRKLAWHRQHEAELAAAAVERLAAKEARREANRLAHAAKVDATLASQAEMSAARRAERSGRSERWDQRDATADVFVAEMAGARYWLPGKHGDDDGLALIAKAEPGHDITPVTSDEFVAWQKQRQANMAATKQTPEQLAEVMRNAR
jgi:hypothetical protein